MTAITQPDLAVEAYDRLAPFYDRFIAGYAHDPWVEQIERHARRLGLRGARALDLACGTGASTAPLVHRGYRVVGCDSSPRMIEQARCKLPEASAEFLVADLRELPVLGTFDLAVCLDDALNYLLDDDALLSAFTGILANLAPGGLFVFDLNTLCTYRESFARAIVRADDGIHFSWRGQASASFASGELADATLDVFHERPDRLWEHEVSRHVQRHHPAPLIRQLLAHAGLELPAVLGQLPGGRLMPDADEQRHIKLVYFARRPRAEIDAEGGEP